MLRCPAGSCPAPRGTPSPPAGPEGVGEEGVGPTDRPGARGAAAGAPLPGGGGRPVGDVHGEHNDGSRCNQDSLTVDTVRVF